MIFIYFYNYLIKMLGFNNLLIERKSVDRFKEEYKKDISSF